MDFASSVVSHAITLELIDSTGHGLPVEAQLSYHRQDPYAVTAVFATGASEVRWVFSRDLLADGIYSPEGEGDVHVWPCLDPQGRAVVVLELSSPDGEAMLQARSADLTEFIRSTCVLVPRGQEADFVDLDSALHELLGTAS